MYCYTAPSQKAHHPSDFILKAEAHARAIKPRKPSKKIPAHAASRNASKTEKTLPTVSLNLLKSERSKPIPSPTPDSLESVAQKTIAAISPNSNKAFKQKSSLAVSRNPQKERRLETTSAPSPLRLKSAVDKITPAKSRSSLKYWSLVTQSVARSSEITHALKHSSTRLIPKVTLRVHLYTSPSHSELGTRAVTSNVLPSSQNTLKRNVSLQNSTFLLLGNRSKTLTNAILNSTVKVVPSTQVNPRNVKSKKSRGQQISSPMSHLRTQTLSSSGFNQSVGKNQTTDSRETVAQEKDEKYCKEIQISHDVSPPSGTAVALGPVPDMRTCIHLSCDVGGDVAYMRSLHCFVITCDNSEMCEPGQMKAGDVSSDIVQVAFLRKRGQFEKGRLLLFLLVRAPQYQFLFSLKNFVGKLKNRIHLKKLTASQ